MVGELIQIAETIPDPAMEIQVPMPIWDEELFCSGA